MVLYLQNLKNLFIFHICMMAKFRVASHILVAIICETCSLFDVRSNYSFIFISQKEAFERLLSSFIVYCIQHICNYFVTNYFENSNLFLLYDILGVLTPCKNLILLPFDSFTDKTNCNIRDCTFLFKKHLLRLRLNLQMLYASYMHRQIKA